MSRLKLNGLDGAFSRRVRHPDLRIDAAVVLFESLPPIVNPSSGIAHPRRVRRGVRQGDHREAELPADRVGQKRLNCPMQLRLETSATRGQRRVPEALVVRVRRICRSPHGLQFCRHRTGRRARSALRTCRAVPSSTIQTYQFVGHIRTARPVPRISKP